MTKKTILFVWLLIFFAFTWLGGKEIVEAIVAIVNEDIITISDYKRQHDSLYQMLREQIQGEEFEKQYNRLSKELLNTMITERLLFQEAKKLDVDVSEQIKLTIENIKKENNIETDQELMRIMQQQGIDFEVWKKNMEETFLKQQVLFAEVDRGIVIDDAEIVNYYKQHNDEFTELPEYRLSAIYLISEGVNDSEIQERKNEIERQIAEGNDFGSLASQYSDGPEKETQGDLGTFKKGELEKSLEQEVEKLKIGEVSPWLKVKGGWYILKLVDKKESRMKTFEEVRKEIEEKLFGEKRRNKYEEFLKKLKERSYIKILIPDPLELIQ
ncbi:MAG: peptidylprolyl isomerase [Acidobacteriota bacterium]|nr:peptidylprolyl isomerase [Acidobacteriota bacterium]